ncbi:MAG: hypothetical protein AB7G87_06880 [Clostridia bacterium]
MNRLELYKRRKRSKRLFVLTILVSLAIVVVGLITVDYSVNSMLGINDEIKIASLVKTGDSVYELDFMNCEVEVNLSYIKIDWNNMVGWLDKYYQKAEEYVTRFNNYTRAVTNTE